MGINLGRLVRGDKAAWDAFVERFSPVIYAGVSRTLFARSSRATEEDVRDLAQSVFIRLLKDDCRLLRRYDPSRASLVTWLTIVSRSAALDFLRRKTLSTVPLDGEALQVSDGKAARPVLPLSIPEGLLSPRQALVLHLLFDRDMAVEEAAGLLGVEPQTVRSINHKALTKLRAFFREPT
ncbi:MAG: sigma-70 family RNA polymerase sigma factor [bacterium]|nr:sigma-70 family RNA polymerase sigma factor [bacterium]